MTMNKTAIEDQLSTLREAPELTRMLRIASATIALLSLYTATSVINAPDSSWRTYSLVAGAFLFVSGVVMFAALSFARHPQTGRIVRIDAALSAQLEQLKLAEREQAARERSEQARARLLERREQWSKKITANPPRGRIDGREYVYVIQETDLTGYYKIGRTNSPYGRFGQFTAKFPFNFRIVMLFVVDNSHEAERDFHAMFAPQRRKGEWFELDADDLEYLYGLTPLRDQAPAAASPREHGGG